MPMADITEKQITEKELRKLSKIDLFEILTRQSAEIDRLNKELRKTKAELENRQIMLDKCGSIAEASLEIYKVLESAQKAAELYLENVGRFAGSPSDIVK